MNKKCILSDFDGTITKKDGLYSFIETYAKGNWQDIEQSWAKGKIDSKTCLIEEFKLIPNLSEKLIVDFIDYHIDIDENFCDFIKKIRDENIDFFIVSDGLDFFIEKILKKYEINNLKIFSNHAEFVNGQFKITFPNDYSCCENNSGTCKCKILSDLRSEYDKIIYIGDGVSDYCVAPKADILFAKSKLENYCKTNSISYNFYDNFSDIFYKI